MMMASWRWREENSGLEEEREAVQRKEILFTPEIQSMSTDRNEIVLNSYVFNSGKNSLPWFAHFITQMINIVKPEL